MLVGLFSLLLVILVMLMNQHLNRMFGMPMVRGWVRGVVIVSAMFILGVLSNFERAYAPTARPSVLAQKVWAGGALPTSLVRAGTAGEVNVWGVADGNTLQTDIGTVKLLGISAPSGSDCYAEESASRLRALVLGKKVLLHSDPSVADVQGERWVARYVEMDGEDIGALLVIGGSARRAGDAFGLARLYGILEEDVRGRGEGVWGACPV
jgi:endonuclease YncB( thermonuclease family)